MSFDLSGLDPPAQHDLACASVALAAVGLDFSFPETGPIKGDDEEWKIVEGGLKMGARAGYKVTEAIVEL